ncbi:unnamed protein product [marine sediment metagenome]|uniref:Uncharacterized protein n=1 Tax=marine sediment metagenome TaxID=412755 RepID=X1LR50_9ZZZZ
MPPKYPTTPIIMAILDEHGTHAKKDAVQTFSFPEGRILVALMAGTVQPKPNDRGMNDFPERLNFFKNLSKLTINLERN